MLQLAAGQDARTEEKLDAIILGISTNHSASQSVFKEQLALDFPLVSSFGDNGVIEAYVGWLDREKRLSNRGYVLVDRNGIVRYVQVMDNPGEVLSMDEIKMILSELNTVE